MPRGPLIQAAAWPTSLTLERVHLIERGPNWPNLPRRKGTEAKEHIAQTVSLSMVDRNPDSSSPRELRRPPCTSHYELRMRNGTLHEHRRLPSS